MANNLFGGIQPAVPVAPSVTTANPPVPQMAMRSVASNPMPNQQIQQGGSCNVRYVANMEEMLNIPTTPNEHLYFPESDSNVIWLRETDGNGQIKNPVTRLICQEDQVPFGPEANFVTKQQHQELYDMVAAMAGTMNGMAESINWLKNELGGKGE